MSDDDMRLPDRLIWAEIRKERMAAAKERIAKHSAGLPAPNTNPNCPLISPCRTPQECDAKGCREIERRLWGEE